MLQQRDLKEFSIGDKFTLFLVVNKIEIKEAKSGKSFINLELRDRSAILPAKLWDNIDSYSKSITEGSIVKLAGQIEEYNNSPQIKIEKIRLSAADDDVTPEDFLPKSKRSLNEMLAELNYFVESVQNSHCNALLKYFFEGENLQKYIRTPAGKSWHHAYLHGLLEHTLEITKICKLMCEIHPEINYDILISGALLHDFGKTIELSYDTKFDYTDKGKLIGHIVICAIEIEKAVEKFENFPADIKDHIIHLVLSHQGKLEYASPVEPKTLEAIVLYQADELSAKTNAYKSAIESEKNKGSNWTKFLPLANTSLFIPSEK